MIPNENSGLIAGCSSGSLPVSYAGGRGFDSRPRFHLKMLNPGMVFGTSNPEIDGSTPLLSANSKEEVYKMT